MGIYDEELDKIWMSHSTLHTYEECPYQFYLKKIEKLEGVSNGYADIGGYGHKLFQAIFSGKMTPEEAIDKCINELPEKMSPDISEDSFYKKQEALCDYLTSLDIEEFFNKYQVLGVEKQFRWNIDGIKMIGYADLILQDAQNGKVYLVDHKSSGHFMKADGITPLKNQKENLSTYTKQMYLYADAMKKIMGFYPNYIVWNHFLDGGKKTILQFNEKDLEATIEWVKGIVEEIYNDEEFIDNQSYMMCNVLCPYREICEYKNG